MGSTVQFNSHFAPSQDIQQVIKMAPSYSWFTWSSANIKPSLLVNNTPTEKTPLVSTMANNKIYSAHKVPYYSKEDLKGFILQEIELRYGEGFLNTAEKSKLSKEWFLFGKDLAFFRCEATICQAHPGRIGHIIWTILEPFCQVGDSICLGPNEQRLTLNHSRELPIRDRRRSILRCQLWNSSSKLSNADYSGTICPAARHGMAL